MEAVYGFMGRVVLQELLVDLLILELAILARQTTFAARKLWHNKLVGDAFRNMLAHGLRQHSLEIEKEVFKRTHYGIRSVYRYRSLEK